MSIHQVYNEKLKSLALKYSKELIHTSFGKTNVLIFGDATKPPLILVHGLNSAAPFALDAVSFFTRKVSNFCCRYFRTTQ
ncbi:MULTISPECIES: hypothetical protein [unclassified Polaribacter]|uniref:hypothetical protein n=1 Tax=unclassified Polaribacter TaxID=196858 RepID=UPI0011BD4BCC|nr:MULTISPECIES: hypothetical protein [unclassified Polaribacter]TXD53386.1 hypothetical protein ES043_04070 [Polaribacter sp. IC063]